MWDLPHIPPVDPTIGEERGVVHDWTLGRKIGKGEFATVHECRTKGESETFACKLINKNRVGVVAAFAAAVPCLSTHTVFRRSTRPRTLKSGCALSVESARRLRP